MRLGLHALGLGAGARREVIEAVARTADNCGFATLWAGEHVVMVERPDSPYPYHDAGQIPVPADADWLDPFICLSFAAAASERIALATGILLLPEHNPIHVAKQAASLDVLSGGRFQLGVGIGWSREEFAALGVPFAHRARRTIEYVEAMRELWREGSGSFGGAFVKFDSIYVYPKPACDSSVPVIFGGNSDAALARVAGHGDGWFGFNLSGIAVAGERIDTLRRLCAVAGRHFDTLSIAVHVAGCQPEHVTQLERLGVTELVLVEAPPADPDAAVGWVRDLARRWRLG